MKKKANIKGLVLKVASRCNLNCSYCYMYNLGDLSYLNQPKKMSNEVVEAVINQVKRQSQIYDLNEFEFIFHGGEPLLLPKAFFRNFVTKAQSTLKGINLRFGVQTNGSLLDDEWCSLLKELGVGVGISIDGPEEIHNIYRIDKQGIGSFDAVVRGIGIANQNNLKIGILSVVNPATDAREIYGFFKSLNTKSIDFLFPDHHHDFLPNQYQENGLSPDFTPFGDWWIKLFDSWFYGQDTKPSIRFLSQIILMIIGIDNGFETIGQQENNYLIIETDGSIEASDYLKACGDGFTKEGKNVLFDDFDKAVNTHLITLHRHSHRNLPKQCTKCPIKDVCGGGHLAHRFSREREFDNPSIYCFDLMKLITHIQNIVVARLPKEIVDATGIEPIQYEEVIETLQISGFTQIIDKN
ncbi:MAG: radical SAM protein [Spirosomataceae bacterium]